MAQVTVDYKEVGGSAILRGDGGFLLRSVIGYPSFYDIPFHMDKLEIQLNYNEYTLYLDIQNLDNKEVVYSILNTDFSLHDIPKDILDQCVNGVRIVPRNMTGTNLNYAVQGTYRFETLVKQ